MNTIWKLTIAHLRMYSRDRQSLFFALFFPMVLMIALGYFAGSGEVEPIEVSVVPASSGVAQETLLTALRDNPLLRTSEESEEAARTALAEGERDAVLLLPDVANDSDFSSSITLSVLIDESEPRQTQQTLAILESTLQDVEHSVRGTEPLFTLAISDVESRNLRYVDFLIPGLLAFMVMQLSVAGSGFNIVEYKRKGILKRLFATPLRPLEFIISLIASRLVIVLTQITLLLIVAKLLFDITVLGNIFLLYLFVILGSILFLGIGFALGGVAKTQNAVMTFGNLIIFPQIFLAGVFFPLDSLPNWLYPLAFVLPLNFVSDAIRQVANEGVGIAALSTDVLGILIWTIAGVLLAVRLFKWGETGKE